MEKVSDIFKVKMKRDQVLIKGGKRYLIQIGKEKIVMVSLR